MLRNKTTEKMPCWNCKKDGICPIQDALCSVPYQVTKHLDGLTFECDEMEETK